MSTQQQQQQQTTNQSTCHPQANSIRKLGHNNKLQSDKRMTTTNKLAILFLAIVILELMLVSQHQVSPLKLKKKIYLKKLKKLLPLFALIKPKKKIILLPVPIPMKGSQRFPGNPSASASPASQTELSHAYNSPMTMAAMMPLTASPTNPLTSYNALANPLIPTTAVASSTDAMMGFMANSVPAIIRMFPQATGASMIANSSSSSSSSAQQSPALAATTMTMTIHAPTHTVTTLADSPTTADATALAEAMQAALKAAPIVQQQVNNNKLVDGNYQSSSSWNNRPAPPPSPSKIYHATMLNNQRYQQQQQQQQQRLVQSPRQRPAGQRSSNYGKTSPANLMQNDGPMHVQQHIEGHEIEELVPIGPAQLIPVYQTQNGQLHMSPPQASSSSSSSSQPSTTTTTTASTTITNSNQAENNGFSSSPSSSSSSSSSLADDSVELNQTLDHRSQQSHRLRSQPPSSKTFTSNRRPSTGSSLISSYKR